MSVLVIQLSDLHIRTGTEAIFKRWDALCRAIKADVDNSVEACVIVFGGDAAHGGKASEFDAAFALLDTLRVHISLARPGIPIHTLTVPGNHDCDLTSEDLQARTKLRTEITNKAPPPSISRVLLGAQAEYFAFAKKIGADGSAFDFDSPYYRSFDLKVNDGVLRFHLLNSSWSSVLNDVDDLRFPLDAFAPPATPQAKYAIAIIHHPAHWFRMPDVRRELRDKLETYSDLILTGHEHENEASRRTVRDGRGTDYVEGGVLDDVVRPDLCSFNLFRFDLRANSQQTKRLEWQGDHFEPLGACEETPLYENRMRADRQLRLTAQFEDWLDELEDPLTHPRIDDLRLSHLFAYPDLRKVVEARSDQHRADDDGAKAHKHAEVIEIVKSEQVLAELEIHGRSVGRSGLGRSGAFGGRSGQSPISLKTLSAFDGSREIVGEATPRSLLEAA